MGRVRIVADSTCDLPVEIRNDLGIEVVPLKVHFGEEVYLDQVTIDPMEFYKMLETARPASELPHTSQPSPGDFVTVYERLANDPETDAIVSIHLSSKLSGTYQSAVIASQDIKEKGVDVEVVDGAMASSETGALVVAAARASQAGLSKAEVMEQIEAAKSAIRVVFVVDSLEYLRRNGRIGRAASLVGGLLKIKPILTVADGVVTPVEKLRGSSRVIPRMVELISENADEGQPQIVYIMNADCQERANEFEARLRERVPVKQVIHTIIGPVIGSHVGPGTLAVAWHRDDLWFGR